MCFSERRFSTLAGGVLLFASGCFAQQQPGRIESRSANEIFRASVVSVAASTSYDVVSKWDSYRMGQGVYGAKQAALESSMNAGIIVAEHFLVKKYPKTRRLFTVVNFGLSAYHLGSAVHNSTRPNPADVNLDGNVNILDLQTRVSQGGTPQDMSYILGQILH
jgi:hypothetical protein